MGSKNGRKIARRNILRVSLSRARILCPPFSGLLVTIVVIASVQSIEHAALDFGLLGGALGRASLALESRLHRGRHFILHVGGLPFHLRALRTHALVCLWIEISSVAQGATRQNFTAERWATEKGWGGGPVNAVRTFSTSVLPASRSACRRSSSASRRFSMSRTSPQSLMMTCCFGRSFAPRGTSASSITESMPSITRPKTTCLPSSQGAGLKVMKNCELLVFLPQLAIDRSPRAECLMAKPPSSGKEGP